MADTNSMETAKQTVGDRAVDGLFGGIIAGILMAVYLIVAGIITGEDPGIVLARFTPSGDGAPLIGGAAHLAVSAVYGAIFAVILSQIIQIRPALRRLSWLLGAGYGLSLWLAAEFVILPTMDSPLLLIPPIHFAIAHLIFGLVLGAAFGRSSRTK